MALSTIASFGSDLIKIAIRILLIGLLIFGLSILGYQTNLLIPFDILTNFFVLIKNIMGIFNFMLDIPTLFIILGYMLAINLLWLVFKYTAFVIKYFNEK